jgi:hypothetical protein
VSSGHAQQPVSLGTGDAMPTTPGPGVAVDGAEVADTNVKALMSAAAAKQRRALRLPRGPGRRDALASS